MTTAVLFTGQERSLARTIRLLRRNLLEPNSVVVFFACESDNPDRFLSHFSGLAVGGTDFRTTFRDSEFHSLVQLISSSNRPALRDEVFRRTTEGWTANYVWNSGTLLQYYQLWKAWQLLLSYERTHSMVFTNVVRCRPDCLLTETIDLSKLSVTNDELASRGMGSARIQAIHAARQSSGEYEHPLGHPYTSKVIWTLGHEQIWIAKRDVFALFGPMVFQYGCWDSGGRCAFNSETFFHQFCVANHVTHWACIESLEHLFNYSHPGNEEVLEDPHIFSLLR